MEACTVLAIMMEVVPAGFKTVGSYINVIKVIYFCDWEKGRACMAWVPARLPKLQLNAYGVYIRKYC